MGELKYIFYCVFQRLFFGSVEQQRELEVGLGEGGIIHLLVHLLNICTSSIWARMRAGARASTQVSHVAGRPGLTLSAAASPGTLAGRRIEAEKVGFELVWLCEMHLHRWKFK